MSDIEEIRQALECGQLHWTEHAIRALANDGMLREDLRAISASLTIANTTDTDCRGTEYLLAGRWHDVSINLVVTWLSDGRLRIVTAYVPKAKRRGGKR
jgi:hypothetical protein